MKENLNFKNFENVNINYLRRKVRRENGRKASFPTNNKKQNYGQPAKIERILKHVGNSSSLQTENKKRKQQDTKKNWGNMVKCKN